VGLNSYSGKVAIEKIEVYHYSLPEKSLPTLSGDALFAYGHIESAYRQYRHIAGDFSKSLIGKTALLSAYLCRSQSDPTPEAISDLEDTFASFVREYGDSKEYSSLLEMKAVRLWKQRQFSEALSLLKEIFERTPNTSIVLELLAFEHSSLSPENRAVLAKFIPRTKDLQTLDISGFGFEDLEFLKGMPLKSLSANNNPLRDLSALAGLSLERLDISNTLVNNLSPLKGMPLRFLTASNTGISDLTPLQGAPLQVLNVSNTSAADLEPLKGMKLVSLEMDSTDVISLDPLSGMATLANLSLSSCPVTDFHPTASLPALRSLKCASVNLETLDFIPSIPKLKSLAISNNRIRDLSPLKGLPLSELYANNTLVTTLDPLAGMPLRRLFVGGNHIPDLTPLAGMPLRSLGLGDNKIKTLMPLEGMQLLNLNCANNPLVSLAPFIENPPKRSFLFSGKDLPDKELKAAVTAWQNKPDCAPFLRQAQIVLALRESAAGRAAPLDPK
ncbi:MAG: hypothetical protein WCJ49_09790, partial [Deltaproteobacteria bacterium]